MNKKKEIKNRTMLKLVQGLTGAVFAVSAFMLPVTGFAEEAAAPQKMETAQQQVSAVAAEQKPAALAPQKYVMPREQVYLDPSQVEAAKKQLEGDAFYNDRPQAKNVEIVTGDRVIADVKVIEKDETASAPETEKKKGAAQEETVTTSNPEKENAVKAENKSEIKKAETKGNVTVQPENSPAEKPAVTEAKDVKAEQPVTVQPKEAEKDKTETPEMAKENAAKPENAAGITATDNTTGNAAGNKTAASQPQEASKQKPVRLHRFGVAREFTTHQATVGDVLKDAKINMEGRTVYPPPETKITDGMIIHVLARKSFLSREEVEVPFGTQFIDDPELAFGDKKVEKEGVKGKDLVIFENITRAGHEQKIELDRRRIAEPVNAVVRQGVAQSILTPNGYVKYKKVLYGEATAYTWGGGASGHTSVGLWPKRGIVAVDPRVIPYYTKLYIPGYGMAIAGDTGGAIVGTRIDLFMDSLHECYQWGRRDVEIYILE